MSVRVTGGTRRGRRLVVPRVRSVRPTADRVRESLFAWLPDLTGARVLDLFAGSGSLGIEALSRDAEFAIFVEKAPRCLIALNDNLRALEFTDRAHVQGGDAVRVVRRLGRAGETFDQVFLDPPYESDLGERALAALVREAVLAPDARIVLERSRRQPLPAAPRLALREERRYGETVLSLFAQATK